MKKIYDTEKIVSVKIFEKEKIENIKYETGKTPYVNNKWFDKIKNFLIPVYGEGYYIISGFQREGPYTKEYIEENYKVIIEENIVYEKPYIIVTFTNGESVFKQFNSVQELESHISIFNLIPKNCYIVES